MAQIAILAVGALMALNKGAQKRKQHMQDSGALRDAAMRTKASATADMSEEIRRKEQMESRAIAVSAASGAGVDDPTIVNLIGDLNAEGEYRVLQRLWIGENEAEGQLYRAEAAQREGDAALDAGYANAISTVMSSYSGGSMPSYFSGLAGG